MRYSIGNNIADFGFYFLEKVHEPIFLVNRLGKVIKMNEAGRKFLKVARLSSAEVENFVHSRIANLFRGVDESFNRIKVNECDWQIIAHSFLASDNILVELKR